MTPLAVSAKTRVFAVLGDPVAHSLSPAIQNAALRSLHIDAVYVALKCDRNALPGILHGLAHAGGGGNVTIPHKGIAVASIGVATAAVRATRACNTFWLKRGRVYGDNTDVAGFSAALRNVLADVKGSRALIVGAGGAARAAVYALLEDGCANITVLGRSRGRARELAAVAGRRAKRVTFVTAEAALRDEGFDVVVNATPLGLRAADRLPLRLDRVAGVRAVFDMVYAPGRTRWVAYARSLGIPAVDGGEMLIRQGAAAFERWFEADAPLAAMRKAFNEVT